MEQREVGCLWAPTRANPGRTLPGTRDHAAMNLHSVSDDFAESPAQSRRSIDKFRHARLRRYLERIAVNILTPVRAQETPKTRSPRLPLGDQVHAPGRISGNLILDTRKLRSKIGRAGLGVQIPECPLAIATTESHTEPARSQSAASENPGLSKRNLTLATATRFWHARKSVQSSLPCDRSVGERSRPPCLWDRNRAMRPENIQVVRRRYLALDLVRNR